MTAAVQHVALLRAINVTGRYLKMTDLAAHFHALGHADARTHINSGNVIFSAAAGEPPLAARLEADLAPRLGFVSEVFLRTAAEVQAIALRGAALQAAVPAGGAVSVIFLSAPPSAAQCAALDGLRSEIDDFSIEGAQVYWLCQGRQSDSRCSNALLERRLRLRTTLRRASMLAGLAARLQRPVIG